MNVHRASRQHQEEQYISCSCCSFSKRLKMENQRLGYMVDSDMDFSCWT